jgi:hypothetical protein
MLNSVDLSWHVGLVVGQTILVDLFNGSFKKGLGFLNGLLILDLGHVELASLIVVEDLVNHLIAVFFHHLSVGFVDVFVKLSDLLEVTLGLRVVILNLIDGPKIDDWQLVELHDLCSHVHLVLDV